MKILPEHLRETLKEPIGQLVDEQTLISLVSDSKPLISVGDMVTYTLLKHNIAPDVSIVDYVHKRSCCSQEIIDSIKKSPADIKQVKNPAGTLTEQLIDAIHESIQRLNGPQRIEVEGEEDLAALVAISLAPQGATVIYGLPNKGVVVVPVNEYHKNKAKEIIDKM